jgi:hypothetical protein
MLLGKELQGSTVERVYWAVPSRDWLPVIGEPFDTFRDAADHADRLMVEQNKGTILVYCRMVFRKPNGTTVDMEVDKERRFR